MTLSNKTIDLLVHLRLRTERGQSYFNFLKTPFLLAASLKIFGLPLNITFIIGMLMLVVFYMAGTLDRKYGIWLRENEIRTREYNPYFRDLEDKI